MARTRQKLVVLGDRLVFHDGCDENTIGVGTPEWYSWLTSAKTFYFLNHTGSFSARRDRAQRGGWYWKAYCTRSRKVYRAYLGKAEDLTLDRLNDVAKRLAAQSTAAKSSSEAVSGIADASPCGTEEYLPTEWSRGDTLPPNSHYGSLLVAKLSLPPLRSDFVARPQLFDRLTQGMRYRLMLVSAPAGYGKTTLVGQWCRWAQCPVAWLTLDRSENDPARFWTYFIAALNTVHPHIGNASMNLLRSSQSSSMEDILTILSNELNAVKDELVFVFDDYHLVESTMIHMAVAFLLEHIPPQIHFVVVTRSDPPLPLARLRARAQLVELRADDLTFDVEETEIFLNHVMGMELSSEQISVLKDRTEGWVAALQLVALSVRRFDDDQDRIRAFSGCDRYVMSYLMEEVLSGQPEGVKRFLLRTSILDRLNGSLCDAVMRETGSQAMLELLERANLFIVALDNQGNWYRYHHLFVEFLRSFLLRFEPELVGELHRRASKWFVDNELPHEGMTHALATDDFEQAAVLIEQIAPSMLMRREIPSLLGFLKKLPDDVVRTRPRLCLMRAKALLFIGQIDSAQLWLENAEGTLSSLEVDGAVSEYGNVYGEILSIRLAISAGRGDWIFTLALSQHVLEYLQEGDSTLWKNLLGWISPGSQPIRNVEIPVEELDHASRVTTSANSVQDTVLALSLFGGLHSMVGNVRQSLGLYRQALDVLADAGLDPTSTGGDPYVGLAGVAYEWNDLAAAADYARKGIDLGERSGITFNAFLGYLCLTDVRWVQGKTEQSFQLLQRAEQLVRTSNLLDGMFAVEAYRARLWLRQGNISEAIQWMRSTDQSISDELNVFRWMHDVAMVQVRLACGEYERVRELLEPKLMAEEQKGKTSRKTMHFWIISALAAKELGDHDQALSNLSKVLSLGEPEGLVRTFVDYGFPMASLLTEYLKASRRVKQMTAL